MYDKYQYDYCMLAMGKNNNQMKNSQTCTGSKLTEYYDCDCNVM